MIAFACSRAVALRAVEQLGAARCSYGTFPTEEDPDGGKCDCKYGTNFAAAITGEEVNGCPELRTIHALLYELTDQAYELLLANVNAIVIYTGKQEAF